MEHLFHAFASQFQFSIRRLLRFFDKSVQDHRTSTYEKAIERSPDSRLASRPEFKQTLSKRARVREPQIWAMLHEQLCNARVVRKDIHRPRLDLSEYLRMKVFDGIRHAAMF